MTTELSVNIFSSKNIKKSYKEIGIKLRKIIDTVMVSAIVGLAIQNMYKNRVIDKKQKLLETSNNITKDIDKLNALLKELVHRNTACNKDIEEYYKPNIKKIIEKTSKLREENEKESQIVDDYIKYGV